MQKFRTPLLVFFLSLELILYYLILTAGGEVLRWSSYISIILCFVYALTNLGKDNRLLIAGLLLTVCADTCLVLCQPIQQLCGMIFFFFAQSCYTWHLHRKKTSKTTLMIRGILLVVAELICILVLRDKTDALATISIGYYVFLIMNIADAFYFRKRGTLLPWAFILFLLCDTVIGLQVMSSGYLPIPEGSLVHNILYSGFNLAWFFYLPSQVLISLTTRRK